MGEIKFFIEYCFNNDKLKFRLIASVISAIVVGVGIGICFGWYIHF